MKEQTLLALLDQAIQLAVQLNQQLDEIGCIAAEAKTAATKKAA